MALTDAQYQEAADLIGCNINAIKTVYQIEAAGKGFLPDGRIKILFEGHRFWKQLVKAGKDPGLFISSYPEFSNVLYRVWDRKQYKGGVKEWDRMSLAIEVCLLIGIPPEAALDSASYGAFQIMGENAELCGYDSAQDMVTSFNNGGEKEQLNAFVRFVKSKKLDVFLKVLNWMGFAKGYNGTAYRENKYDTKLHAFYTALAG